jgi:hypothetical protein
MGEHHTYVKPHLLFSLGLLRRDHTAAQPPTLKAPQPHQLYRYSRPTG